MKKALNHFKKADPLLYQAAIKVVKIHGEFKLKPINPDDYFEELCESIVNQQLSVKAGDTIFNRLKALCENNEITPKNILKLENEKIRSAGLSNAKVSYIKDLAEKVEKGEVNLKTLSNLSDEEVIVELTKIKGIGKWTAEMFLMFSLSREDIFSFGDLGLVNAFKKLYGEKNYDKRKMEEVITKWSPYKTYGARILWKSLEL